MLRKIRAHFSEAIQNLPIIVRKCNPMRWVNRLLYNNDKLKPIASVVVVNVTSVQAIGEERL